jgi:hypothetical protein
MIKKFFGKSGVVFIIPLFILFILFACAWAQPVHQDGRLAGGPCQYKSYPGQATILSITGSQTSNPGQVKRFDVKFSFTPQEKIEESYARVEGKTFDLYGNNYQYPDQEFITVNNIQVGKVLDGSLQVIVSGTCTPVLFDFPVLKQEK